MSLSLYIYRHVFHKKKKKYSGFTVKRWVRFETEPREANPNSTERSKTQCESREAKLNSNLKY